MFSSEKTCKIIIPIKRQGVSEWEIPYNLFKSVKAQDSDPGGSDPKSILTEAAHSCHSRTSLTITPKDHTWGVFKDENRLRLKNER